MPHLSYWMQPGKPQNTVGLLNLTEITVNTSSAYKITGIVEYAFSNVMAEELEMVARLNSHESNLINRMDRHAKAAINTHVPGFLECSRRMPEGTESRSQHGRPGPNGSPCSNKEV